MGSKGGMGGLIGAGVGFAIGGPLGAVALGSAGMQMGAQMDAADAAEDLARRNKNLSKEQAKSIMRRAKVQSQGILREGREFTGAQVSSFAAGGVDVSSESALIVMENAAARFKQDAYETLRTANEEGKIINARASAGLDAAKANKRATTIGAVAGFIGTGASVAMMNAGGGGTAPTSKTMAGQSNRSVSNIS